MLRHFMFHMEDLGKIAISKTVLIITSNPKNKTAIPSKAESFQRTVKITLYSHTYEYMLKFPFRQET